MPEWSNGVDCKSIVRRFESYPALRGDNMKIVELVNKLEEIEKETDGKARDLCGKLIDDLIEYDIEMSKFMNKVNRDVMKGMEREEDSLIEYLINQGIQSGSIGEA